jgi:hypothetical protein
VNENLVVKNVVVKNFCGQTVLVLRQGESAKDRGWSFADSKVPVPECVGENLVKLGVRNREIQVKGSAVLGTEGRLSRLFMHRQKISVPATCWLFRHLLLDLEQHGSDFLGGTDECLLRCIDEALAKPKTNSGPPD